MISVIRVLHVVGSLNAGGIETFLMSVYRQIDRSKVQFDFLVSSDQRFSILMKSRVLVVGYIQLSRAAITRKLLAID